MNIKLLASLSDVIQAWVDENCSEDWFPELEWTDDIVPLLVGTIHNVLVALESSNKSLKDAMKSDDD